MGISIPSFVSVNPQYMLSLSGPAPSGQASSRPPGIAGNSPLQPAETNTPAENSSGKNDQGSTVQEPAADSSSTGDRPLTDQELREVQALKKKDTEVKNHEMAHIAAGGNHIKSGARFEYQRGPDGNNYAVAGEVSIDTSPVPGDPRATLSKMREIKMAALAPMSPSSQDRKVAAQAASLAIKAQAELSILLARERQMTEETVPQVSRQSASDAYAAANSPDLSASGGFHITF